MGDERPHAPTAARLRRARSDGDIARSNEACGAAAFACAALAAAALAAPLAATFAHWLRAGPGGSAATFAAQAGALALVPAAAAAAGATLAALVQTSGLTFAWRPSLVRCNPIAGITRMVSRDALVTAARSTAAVCLAAAVLAPATRACLAAARESASIPALAAATGAQAARIAGLVALLGGLFGAADYAVVRAGRLRRLRMSHADLKRDAREEDGDPQARQRRAHIHRSFVQGAIERVAQAAFVVTNPAHVAVAIQYEPPRVPLPIVLVRASDDGAARVRELARRHGVPIVEAPELARALFAGSRAGDPIRRADYAAVARVVAALARRPPQR